MHTKALNIKKRKMLWNSRRWRRSLPLPTSPWRSKSWTRAPGSGPGINGGGGDILEIQRQFFQIMLEFKNTWSFPTTLSSSRSHLLPTSTIGTSCVSWKRAVNSNNRYIFVVVYSGSYTRFFPYLGKRGRFELNSDSRNPAGVCTSEPIPNCRIRRTIL